MRISLYPIIFLLVACSNADAACKVTPKIFCAPFAEMAKEMPVVEQKRLLALGPDQVWRLHRGLGMAIRNNFGLWQENDLSAFFKRNGVADPDDMSGPFIVGFIHYLEGAEVNMPDVIRNYHPPELPQPLKVEPNNSFKPKPLRGSA
jgi:hypothetical protein